MKQARQKEPDFQHFLRNIGKYFPVSLMACIPLTAILVVISHSAVTAQEAAPLSLEKVTGDVATLQGALNTIWVFIASILVIFMNAGFAMLEAGLCRQKNAVNILAKNLIVFALSTISFWAIGYSLMFGGTDNAFIGVGGWFLSGDSQTYGLKPYPEGLPISVHFLFQAAFAGTAATIVSGAVAERIKFIDFLIFSLLLVGIAYPIMGHWAWHGSGWLVKLGFQDFAGSTVVHSVGGWAALMGAVILGPRTGKYINGRISAIPGHNMGLATLGCLILWIGWFGFNPGSVLAVNEQVPQIAVITNLAASAGGITATITSWVKHGKPDLTMIINGILAGLVSITAACNTVDYGSAVVIGAIAGVLVVYAISFFDNIRIDDPVGALSVHLVNGIWGTLAVGLFNTKGGLFFGGGMAQLGHQIIGIGAVAAFSVVFSGAVWTILKLTLGLRVKPEEEWEGLDIGEHSMEAYSGFVKETDALVGNQGGSFRDTGVYRSEL